MRCTLAVSKLPSMGLDQLRGGRRDLDLGAGLLGRLVLGNLGALVAGVAGGRGRGLGLARSRALQLRRWGFG